MPNFCSSFFFVGGFFYVKKRTTQTQNIRTIFFQKSDFCTDNKFLASLFCHLSVTPLYTKAGCAALSQKYKEDMNILTHSRRKIQFKLLDVKDQPEDKMCAYTSKFRAFQEFLFHSSDRNGEAYTTEYSDMCDDRYRVMLTCALTAE